MHKGSSKHSAFYTHVKQTIKTDYWTSDKFSPEILIKMLKCLLHCVPSLMHVRVYVRMCVRAWVSAAKPAPQLKNENAWRLLDHRRGSLRCLLRWFMCTWLITHTHTHTQCSLRWPCAIHAFIFQMIIKTLMNNPHVIRFFFKPPLC